MKQAVRLIVSARCLDPCSGADEGTSTHARIALRDYNDVDALVVVLPAPTV